MEGLIYNESLQKILAALQQQDRQLLFEMKDGSIRLVDEVKDYSEVRTALKDKDLNNMALEALFGSNPLTKSLLKKDHINSLFSLLRIVVDHSGAADLKELSAKYKLVVKPESKEGGKILSELLRE